MNTPHFNPEINPPINPDDPKWTAYILGELNDADRLELEAQLEVSPEARALVDELQLAMATLKEELAPFGAVQMTTEQREAIRAAAAPPVKRWFQRQVVPYTLGLAAAAVVVLAVVLPSALRQKVMIDPLVPASVGVTSGASASPTGAEASDGTRPIAQAQFSSTQESAGSLKDVTSTNTATRTSTAEAENKTAETAGKEVRAQATAAVADAADVIGRTSAPAPSVESSETRQKVEAIVSALQNQPTSPAPPPPPAAPSAEQTPPRLAQAAARGGAAVRQDYEVRGGIGAAPAGITPSARAVPGSVFGGVGLGLAAAPPPPPAPPPPASRPLPRSLDANVRVAPNTEAYDRIVDNPFIRATQENLATFSIDVDTASYANVRRFLTQNQMPPRDAVRIEELINYFNYDYAKPTGTAPIAPNMEVAAAPWNPANRLVRIGLKAREIDANRRPPSNLVFLIDVSGSMNTPVKLPLVKSGLKMLVDRLGENDTVSIVVYAGASGLVLPPTSGVRKEIINQAIDSLYPGGSTNGASGIQLAYNQAVANFIRGGSNRVILMTDGDFNVGVTNQGELTRLIEERAKSGVFLSVLGFGMGNIKDSTLEKLADQGNGNYAYIDSINEARKVLVEEMGGTLVTVAKDVKIQVDFNPNKVEAYRLIGYENRVLKTEDFNNDLKDAGDMGAGHTVTALFEVVPKGGSVPGPSIDPSKYTQAPTATEAQRLSNAATSNEMLTLRLRYKLPDANDSTRMDVPLVDRGSRFDRATSDFRFASAVAGFGMILRESPYRGNATFDSVLDMAQASRGQDRNGYRQEFITLVQKARSLR